MKRIALLAVLALLLVGCRSACCPAQAASPERQLVATRGAAADKAPDSGQVDGEAAGPDRGFDRVTVGGQTVELLRVPSGTERLPGFDLITVGERTYALPRVSAETHLRFSAPSDR